MRAAPAALLLVAILLLPQAGAVLATSPGRFDLGTLELGASHEGAIDVTNKGAASVRVLVEPTLLENEDLWLSTSSFTLLPAETRTLQFRLGLPANASGGRHDPRLDFVEAAPEGEGAAVGRVAVTIPVVFWVRNLKIGNLEARDAPTGEDGEARVLVQNFLGHPVVADVRVTLHDEAGREVARQEGRTPRMEANASASLALSLPTAGLPAGAYVLRAEASHEGRASNARVMPFLVGARSLALEDVKVQASGSAGRVAFSVRVANDGTVPLAGVVTFQPLQGDKVVSPVVVETPVLAPGESRVVFGNATLPAGEYGLLAKVTWSGDGSAELPGGAFAVASSPPAGGATKTPFPVVVLLAALLVAALVRTRGRQGER